MGAQTSNIPKKTIAILLSVFFVLALTITLVNAQNDGGLPPGGAPTPKPTESPAESPTERLVSNYCNLTISSDNNAKICVT